MSKVSKKDIQYKPGDVVVREYYKGGEQPYVVLETANNDAITSAMPLRDYLETVTMVPDDFNVTDHEFSYISVKQLLDYEVKKYLHNHPVRNEEE